MVPGRKWSVTSSYLYLFFGEGQREGPAAYRYYRSIVWQQSSKGKFSTSSTLLLDGQIVDRLAAYFQLFFSCSNSNAIFDARCGHCFDTLIVLSIIICSQTLAEVPLC
jgi:hypothetical protein